MASKSEVHEIEIRPGIGTLEMFKFMDYKSWYAIGEFVDNSIASWQRNRKDLEKLHGRDFVLEIRVSLDPSDGGELRVWDNAAGIAQVDYTRAFKPAERPSDQDHLSRYGMGMKTAACWFSDNWMVTSTALGETVERTIKFDIPKIVRQGLERLEPTVKRAKENDHWTELVLWDLNSIPAGRTVGKIKDYLAQMYRRFTASGHVQVFWNDEPLVYSENAVLVAPFHDDGDSGQKRRWEKEFELKLPKGEVVSGRALLFDRGEQAAAGLHLFWRERLIKGSLEDRYRPPEIFGQGNSFRQQRLLVELDLDQFNPTVDKTDFVWGRKNSTEAELLATLKKELDRPPLRMLDQAENYRSTKVDRSTRKAAEAAVSETIDVIREHGADELAEQSSRTLPKEDPLPTPGSGRVASERTLDLQVDGERWRIVIELSDQAADRSRLVEITEKVSTQANGVRRLGIRIALSNPFAVKFATDARSVSLLIRALAGLALAEVSARDAGTTNAGEIRRNFNNLVTNVLAQS